MLLYRIESLNASYRNEEELVDANKILAETNEKLIVQYEREKYLRKELESVISYFFIAFIDHYNVYFNNRGYF